MPNLVSSLTHSIDKLVLKKEQHADDPMKQKDWQLEAKLGQGGFAQVYRAHQKGKAKGQDVAVRLVPLRYVLTGQQGVYTREDLKAHLDWVQGLHATRTCPYILDIYGARILRNDLLTFGELCLGGDLFDRICNSSDGKFTEADARDSMRSLAEALIYVHSIGTIHRDIKPENILYRRKDSHVKDIVLMDFWCAIVKTDPYTYHEGAAGTPGYCAPEMLAGKPYRMNVDEFSFGVTCYEALTGRSPFCAQDPEGISREAIDNEIPWPSRYWCAARGPVKECPHAAHRRDVSSQAQNFVKRLLTKDPDHRMSVEEAVHHPWLTETTRPIVRHTSSSSSNSSVSSTASQEPLVARQKGTSILSGVHVERASDLLKGGDMSRRMTMALTEMGEMDSVDSSASIP